MKLYLLLGLLLVTHAWAKPKDAEDENEVDDQGVPDEDDEPEVRGGYINSVEDPCDDYACPIGQECQVDGDKPICECVQACPENEDGNLKVCSTKNVTFASECELELQNCLCQSAQDPEEADECDYDELDYYGACQDIDDCTEEQLEDFPIRMKNWLFLVLEEMAVRKQLSKKAMRIAKKAEKKPQPWATMWKFCDLDNSHDLSIDTLELRPITAPLKAMEHCTGPFIAKCDTDKNRELDLDEWVGKDCLNLDVGDKQETIATMTKMCETLRD